jgi:hypothetical protein
MFKILVKLAFMRPRGSREVHKLLKKQGAVSLCAFHLLGDIKNPVTDIAVTLLPVSKQRS